MPPPCAVLGWVYPRVCGGAPGRLRKSVFRHGSIPACAGEPAPEPGPIGSIFRRVYPRVCGGAHRVTRQRWSVGRCGSIPACAGEPNCTSTSHSLHGSIPACAGEHSRHKRRSTGLSCAGEPRTYDAFDPKGLSPRVRGSRGPGAGSIPACAGEPLRRASGRGLVERSIPACAGEPAASHGASRPRCVGLSPRVRGSRLSCRPFSHCNGSIPACAGEPSTPTRRALQARGLSPRVRGSRGVTTAAWQPSRF